MSPQTLVTLQDVEARAVFGYVRVSTKQQEVERQEGSIPTRHSGLPDGLADAPLELFYDHGISAWSGKTRPDFEKMFERIRAGECAALIVDTSSRLTRAGIREAMKLFFELQDTATRFFTTQGKEYTPDLAGYINLCVDAESDQRYSTTLSHNISSGKATRAKQGLWHHGQLPPGYRTTPEGLQSTPDLAVIGELFQRFLDGHTYSRLCAHAESSFTDETLAQYKGRTVRPDVVRRWLGNPIYAGLIRHRGEDHHGQHQAVVSKATFERVQRRLASNASNFAKPGASRTWEFSGIARCAECRHALRKNPVTNKYGQRYGYVVCSTDGCDGKHRSMPAPAVEASIVVALTATALAAGDLLETFHDWAMPTYEVSADDVAGELREAEELLGELTALVKARAISTTDDDFRAAVQKRDEAEKKLDAIVGREKSYRDALAGMIAQVEALSLHAEPLTTADQRMRLDDVQITRGDTGRVISDHAALPILDGWHAADYDTRRALITETLEAVYVSKTAIELHFLTAIPVPVIERLAIPAVRDDSLRSLEADGWGSTNGVCGVASQQ
jgi:DNA invertase Pin-like site-specific DNA recombinase